MQDQRISAHDLISNRPLPDIYDQVHCLVEAGATRGDLGGPFAEVPFDGVVALVSRGHSCIPCDKDGRMLTSSSETARPAERALVVSERGIVIQVVETNVGLCIGEVLMDFSSDGELYLAYLDHEFGFHRACVGKVEQKMSNGRRSGPWLPKSSMPTGLAQMYWVRRDILFAPNRLWVKITVPSRSFGLEMVADEKEMHDVMPDWESISRHKGWKPDLEPQHHFIDIGAMFTRPARYMPEERIFLDHDGIPVTNGPASTFSKGYHPAVGLVAIVRSVVAIAARGVG